ncbi:MAG: Na+ dependent nucleoside transporter [Flavobacteriales bacterium]|nr:Na+ dependent nucleoside transporter [Flavobacteriales bacterium]
MRISRLFLLVLSFTLLSPVLLATSTDVSITDALQKRWAIVSSSGQRTDQELSIANSKGLVLNESSFEFLSSSNQYATTGTWEVSNGQLILEFMPDPDTSEIDSTSFFMASGNTVVAFYSKGVEVARMSSDRLSASHSVWAFDLGLDDLANGNLTLSRKGVSYILKVEQGPVGEVASTVVFKGEGLTFTSIWRGLLGILTCIFIAYLFSTNRKAINWILVGKGLLIQLVFALLVLKVPLVSSAFDLVGKAFTKIIDFTQAGTFFLFHSFISNKIESSLVNFVINVLPTIIFFAALMSLLYYWGIVQKVVYGFAWLMKKLMKLSGAESLAAAGNIFLGQTESPLLIRPYLEKMTKSELMCLMCGGMATIAGGVLAAYIGFLGGADPVLKLFYAKHLLAASVMSAPAAIVAAKILVPETETINEDMSISSDRIGTNALEAIANGTADGIRLAVNVAGMLLVFIALIAMVNYGLENVIGVHTGLNEKISELGVGSYKTFSLQFIMGLIFAPLSWLLGVPEQDIVLVGQLLGEKTILNEFVAYVSLGDMRDRGAFFSEKSVIMSTYILCGFANFASIGIQIGGIGALVPSRKGVLASLGFRALIGGTLASLFTAVLVGMIL